MKTSKHKISMYLYKIFIILFLSNGLSLADELANKKEKFPAKVAKLAKLAIIGIGPKPPRRYGSVSSKPTSSAAALLPPRLGEVPPSKLYFYSQKKHDFSQKPQSINVAFNGISNFMNVPPNKPLHFNRKINNENNPYLSIEPLKPGSMNVILLRPSGKGYKRWIPVPLKYNIDLLSEELKNKKLMILNLSRRPVKSIFHKDKKLIPAGEFQAYETIQDLELHRIAAVYGRKNKIIYNTALRLDRSKRLLFYVLYDANPNTNDGSTIGLFRSSMDLEKKEKSKN